MPRQVEKVVILIQVEKDEDGELQVSTDAHVKFGMSEYPESYHQDNFPLVNTEQEDQAIKNYVGRKLGEIMESKQATDNLPIPVRREVPEPEPIPEPEPVQPRLLDNP
tara:strand:- start:1276 stop:1599 length:324 start_codon:yes stop_codon:yes gene_type:complete